MTARFNPARFAVYLLLILFALIFLIPVYVLLSSSLKTFAEVQDLSRLWAPPQRRKKTWKASRRHGQASLKKACVVWPPT